MNFPDGLPKLASQTAEVVDSLMTDLRPRLLEAAFSGNVGESENLRHHDNFLSEHDMWMHEQYQELISRFLPSFVYASEEAEPHVVGPESEPDLCVLVDPLDTSELAVRGLLGYTHIMIYSRSLRRPVLSIVGDIYHAVRLYVAARDDQGHDNAFALTIDGRQHRITQRKPKRLAESLVTNFLMRPAERFLPLSRQKRLMNTLDETDSDGKSRGRIGVDFGSVSLCHVATGFTDAVIEFAKGFAIWDLAPGHYYLDASGGVVLDLNGAPVSLDYNLDSLEDIATAMNPRQKFVAAGSVDLAREIIDSLEA
jgi:myo-inositol-1(or 4)-monophosphatase